VPVHQLPGARQRHRTESRLGQAQPGDGKWRRALKGSRKAYFAETRGFVEVSVNDRIRLRPGERVSGPAIMEEADSTTLCPPGYVVRVDDYLNLHIASSLSFPVFPVRLAWEGPSNGGCSA
jgi:N-methylhydantoinase A/oxoprolinase/acetone carboxylase beta subunit